MLKKKNCIYLFSLHPIFNNQEIKKFENLTTQDAVILNSNLVANFIEIVSENDLNTEIVFCFDEKDKDYIPKFFFPESSNFFFTSDKNLTKSLANLEQNYFSVYENNILIRANAIGISAHTIEKTFNMLSIEDDALVIGKSVTKKVALLGFNNIELQLLEYLFSVNYDYDKFLFETGKSDLFLNTLNGFQLIEDFSDFKNLYIELSKKESLSYCSQQIHEQFTNLFIEYKDLLDE
jgi:hypothetical protein